MMTPSGDNTVLPVTMGNITNTCVWEWNQHYATSDATATVTDMDTFDCYGTFSIQGDYVIQTNGRIVQCPSITQASTTNSSSSNSSSNSNTTTLLSEQDHQEEQMPEMILQLLPKSTVPNNVTQLIQYIQRTMSQELFDVMNTGYDITYMDDSIRIIRYYTPNKFNGIRNIFRRC